MLIYSPNGYCISFKVEKSILTLTYEERLRETLFFPELYSVSIKLLWHSGYGAKIPNLSVSNSQIMIFLSFDVVLFICVGFSMAKNWHHFTQWNYHMDCIWMLKNHEIAKLKTLKWLWLGVKKLHWLGNWRWDPWKLGWQKQVCIAGATSRKGIYLVTNQMWNEMHIRIPCNAHNHHMQVNKIFLLSL